MSRPRRRRRVKKKPEPAPAQVADPEVPETAETAETPERIVDPTHVLLGRMSPVISRVPWITVSLIILFVLWVPQLSILSVDPVRPAEEAWTQEAMTPWEDSSLGSAFSRTLTRATWEWQGAELDSVDSVASLTALDPRARQIIRLPAAAASLAALFLFFFLARMVSGPAAALYSATLLAVSEPWIRAGTSALPLIVGEMMVLLGVIWALTLQGRHREVGVAGITAWHIGVAGIFLGLGMLLTPATFATFAATLLIWLTIALRRSHSEATTLPVLNPGRKVLTAVLGAVVLLVGGVLAVWAAERFAGGGGFPRFEFGGDLLGVGRELWENLYRRVLSPGPMTDLLLSVAFGAVVIIRAIEWSSGRPWNNAGIAPWVFLGLWALAYRQDLAAPGVTALDVPMTVPPLFLLGVAWLLLRGFQTGRARRQEYTFVLAWLVVGLLFMPFIQGSHRYAPRLAASLTLLPVVAMIAGRAARAIWESEPWTTSRIGLIVYAYVPVLWLFLGELAEAKIPGAGGIRDAGADSLPFLVLAAAALGLVTRCATVRPATTVAVRESRRPSPRKSGGRRRPGRGGSGSGGSGSGRSGGGRSRGGRSGGSNRRRRSSRSS